MEGLTGALLCRTNGDVGGRERDRFEMEVDEEIGGSLCELSRANFPSSWFGKFDWLMEEGVLFRTSWLKVAKLTGLLTFVELIARLLLDEESKLLCPR